jgi:hypothetical protein
MVFVEASFGGSKQHCRLEPQHQKEVCRSPATRFESMDLYGWENVQERSGKHRKARF